MTDKFKVGALLIAFACLTALAFMGLGVMIGYQRGVSQCVTETDTVVVTDTMVVNRFFTDTVVETKIVPYTFVKHDTVEVEVVDSVVVDLPIESHHCHMEDTADIWYSGFAAMLDSVKVYNHTTTITTEKTLIERKDPRLTANVGVGAMYYESGINPYLVGELRCNAKRTTCGAYGAIDHEGRWGAGLNVTYRMDIIK